MHNSSTSFKILKAYNGDCLLINFFNSKKQKINILVDGGTASTFDYSLKNELSKLKTLDLIILTHIDSDHTGGLIRFFKNSIIEKIEVKQIWVNFPDIVEISGGEKISYGQAKTLEKLIKDKMPKTEIQNYIHSGKNKISIEGCNITVVSPTKEILDNLYKNWPKIEKTEKINDVSKVNISKNIETINHKSLVELNKIPFNPDKSIQNDLINASSISIILECSDLKLLLLADSRPEIIEEYLIKNYSEENKLNVDYVKVSHHGSKNNTSQKMLNYISCDKYIISTNGGTANHKHPSRETIARIVYNEKRNFDIKRFIYFNYPIEEIKKKSGIFINKNDVTEGNWEYLNKNEF
jgi:beta-lactamase superfamily II metal-dependent hydrolase